jgi:type II secretory pathway pseudopilin PulG
MGGHAFSRADDQTSHVLKGHDFSRAEKPLRRLGALAPEGHSRLQDLTKRREGESGYILLGVMILLAVFVIGLAIAAPRVAADIQRDREVETMHRGKQYIRAIQLYYRKFNAYPPSVDALVKTNEIRFLRKRYLDPMTGKDDWKPIMYCQNKAPVAMGFFGAPLGPTTGCGPLAGTGPSGGNGLQGSGLFNNQQGQGNSIFNNGSGANPTNPAQPGVGATGTDPSGTQPGIGASSGTGTSTGTGTATGTGTTTGTDPSNPQSGSIFGSSSDSNNPTLGGGGIMGVSPASEKKSLLVYKKKDHYNQWEFTYSTLMDQQTMQGGNAGTIGTPAGGIGTGAGTGTGGTGTGGGTGSGTGAGSGTGITPQPIQPQQ